MEIKLKSLSLNLKMVRERGGRAVKGKIHSKVMSLKDSINTSEVLIVRKTHRSMKSCKQRLKTVSV